MSRTNQGVSRRRFVGGMAAAAGLLGLRSVPPLQAQNGGPSLMSVRGGDAEFDAYAKLCFNENPYGPPASVIEAMTHAFKYANRYAYPDGGLVEAIAALHGVGTDSVVLGAGSTEVLHIIGTTLLAGQKRVLGCDPTYGSVYEFATGLRTNSIKVPLLPDHRQDIPGLLRVAQENHKDLGFVYLCNPNNPTGAIVTREEIKQLLDHLPKDLPVLIDEAYHHFVESPDYATSIAYVSEGRPVIVTRTFSKIAGLAGVRLGYGIASPALVERMRPYAGRRSVSALANWAGVAALKDTASQGRVREKNTQLRKQTVAELKRLGFETIPSETNFFMVNLRRPVGPVIQAFRQRQVLVGRPFPPMTDYLRVSVGNAQEMERFVDAFKQIVA